MNKAIFLDRDGTINVEKQYLHKIEEFEFLPKAIEALQMLQGAGYLLVIVTNQSGIGRGYYSEEDFQTLNDWMLRTLMAQGVSICKVYYCPHLPDAAVARYKKMCTCRKPLPGMYFKACRELQIDMGQSYAIGDKIRDCAICELTDCRGFLLGHNEDPDIIKSVCQKDYVRVEYAVDLYECAQKICLDRERRRN